MPALEGRGAARSRPSRPYRVFHVRGRAARSVVEDVEYRAQETVGQRR